MFPIRAHISPDCIRFLQNRRTRAKSDPFSSNDRLCALGSRSNFPRTLAHATLPIAINHNLALLNYDSDIHSFGMSDIAFGSDIHSFAMSDIFAFGKCFGTCGWHYKVLRTLAYKL